MRSELFQHELGKTSSVFGRKHDVRVVFQGDGAATDGSTIILPAMDMNADVSDGHQAIMRGYVDHEAGHVRHSDFDAIKRLADSKPTALLRALHNALEDVWLERRVRSEYPGSERNLRATSEAVNKRFLNECPAGDPRYADDKFVAAVAVTWEGRKDYGGETCQQCLDRLPADLQAALRKWVAGLDACRNTQDVIDLARIIEKSINDGDYKDDDYRDGKRASSDGEGADGEGDASGRGDGDDSDDGSSGGEGEPVEAGDSDASSDGSGESDDERDVEATSERADVRPEDKSLGERAEGEVGVEESEVYEDFDVRDCARSELDEAGLTKCESGETYTVFTTAHDKWHTRLDKRGKYGAYTYGVKILAKGEAKDYDDMVSGMAGDINVMRRKFERSLVAKQTRDWDVGREFGRLDTRRLTSAYSGRSNVFKLRDDSTEIDTALMVLTDLSGSMGGQCAWVAQQCVGAIAESIDRTGIKYELLGFNNASNYTPACGPMPESGEAYKGWARHEPLDMYVFKQFEERLFEAKGAISMLHRCAMGNNSDGEAVAYAYDRLRKRPEARKVMLVLSDGFPACHGWGQEQHLRNVINRIEGDGVDCVGVGILSESVRAFYPKWVVVNNVEELASSAMDQLARVLLGERYQIDNSKLMDAHAI